MGNAKKTFQSTFVIKKYSSYFFFSQTTCENHSLYHIPLVQIFACVSCDLASALSAYFEAAAPETTENLPVNLISEWKEFFSEGIHNLLLPLLVKVTGEYMVTGKEAVSQ